MPYVSTEYKLSAVLFQVPSVRQETWWSLSSMGKKGRHSGSNYKGGGGDEKEEAWSQLAMTHLSENMSCKPVLERGEGASQELVYYARTGAQPSLCSCHLGVRDASWICFPCSWSNWPSASCHPCYRLSFSLLNSHIYHRFAYIIIAPQCT